MIHVLTPDEFISERYLGLARRTEQRQQWPRPFNPERFFVSAKIMMDTGALSVWGNERTVLGGLFVNNLFSGDPEAIVSFWWSDGEKEDDFLAVFEAEARRRKCVRLSTSVFGPVRWEAMSRLYRRKGLKPSEMVYGKFL